MYGEKRIFRRFEGRPDGNCETRYYVVGSGITGSIIAHELACHGNHVTVFERRNHTGGNLYDYIDSYGIRVHKYGPHIFHTNSEEVYRYISGQCELSEYRLSCGTVIDGKCFRMPFDIDTIQILYGGQSEVYMQHIRSIFGNRESAAVLEMLESEDKFVRAYAEYIFKKDYQPYTAKQWGMPPQQIDKSVLARVPVYFTHQERYFTDKYEAVPAEGYMALIHKLLSDPNISVRINTEALDIIRFEENRICVNEKQGLEFIIYTGPIDELFGCRYGHLPYRSLRFQWEHADMDSFQDMPVVAYPMEEGYTRITEYKKLPCQKASGTSYVKEYPVPYEAGNRESEPYYPILTKESRILYEKYKGLSDRIENLCCCGRLADFKYYNMDQAVERALEVSRSILGNVI